MYKNRADDSHRSCEPQQFSDTHTTLLTQPSCPSCNATCNKIVSPATRRAKYPLAWMDDMLSFSRCTMGPLTSRTDTLRFTTCKSSWTQSRESPSTQLLTPSLFPAFTKFGVWLYVICSGRLILKHSASCASGWGMCGLGKNMDIRWDVHENVLFNTWQRRRHYQ